MFSEALASALIDAGVNAEKTARSGLEAARKRAPNLGV